MESKNNKNTLKNMEKPQKITDLAENIDLYTEKMRSVNVDEVMAIIKFLEDYIKEEIRILEQSDNKNKELIIELTDNLYRKLMNLKITSIHTSGYMLALGCLFQELSLKGIRIFYILDNSLRDDSLTKILEYLPPAGFTVITPHIMNEFEYEPIITQTDNLSYKEVEAKIEDALGKGRNIFYVERDDSVNYFPEVVELAKNSSDEYVKVLRNTWSEKLEIMEIEKIQEIIPKKNRGYYKYENYLNVGDWWENEGKDKFPPPVKEIIQKTQKENNLSFHEAFKFLMKSKPIIFRDK